MYECIQKTQKKVSDNNKSGAINGSEKASWGDDGGGGGGGGVGGGGRTHIQQHTVVTIVDDKR